MTLLKVEELSEYEEVLAAFSFGEAIEIQEVSKDADGRITASWSRPMNPEEMRLAMETLEKGAEKLDIQAPIWYKNNEEKDTYLTPISTKGEMTMSEHTNTQTQTPEVVPSKYLTTTIAVASSLVLAALTGAASTLGVKAVNRLMPDKKGIGKAGALLVGTGGIIVGSAAATFGPRIFGSDN